MATDEKGPPTRCNAGSVSDIIPHIPASMLERMEELNLTSMTKLQLGDLSYRKTCGDLWNKAIVHKDRNIIEIKIKDDQSLWISPKVVQLVLDMPRGSSKDFKCSSENQTEEYNNMFKALRYVSLKYPDEKAHQANEGHEANEAQLTDPVDMNIREKRKMFTAANIKKLFQNCEKDDVRAYVNDDMLIRLYAATMVDRLLLPSTSFYTSSATTDNVHKVEKLQEIDWSYLVFEHLKSALDDKNSTWLNCCLPLLLVVLADCVEGNTLGMEEPGRINLYTNDMFKNIFEEEKKANHGGSKWKRKGAPVVKSLEDFRLIKWEDSCYGKLENFSHLNRRERYKKKILDRIRDDIVLKFDDYEIVESIFVDSFKPNGLMQSNLLHLVCDLWSRNLDDAIILNEFSVKDLVEGKGTTSLAHDLTEDKVKNAAKIYVPIVSNHHYSLVTVSHTLKKKFILDSWRGRHEKEAHDVLTNLEFYLSNTHGMDISGYDEETPEVEHQTNNYDCGFHVLLYIKGFDKMDIYNITKDEVLEFRIDLSMELLDLSEEEREEAVETRDDDNVETRDEHQGDGPESSRHGTGTSRNSTSASTSASMEESDESEHDEEEEEEMGEENAREVGDGHVGTSNTSNDGTAASREDEEAKEGGNHSSNTTEKPKKLAKRKRTQRSAAEEDEEAKEGGMAKRKRKPHSAAEDDEKANTTVKTPTNRVGRRRVPPRTAIAFRVDKALSCGESQMLCQHIQEKHNDEVVFTVGGTQMTGAELLKCRDDAESSMNIVDAFIECLKCDDKKNGIEKTRIILQRQHQVLEEEVVQVIAKEIGSSKIKGANIEQRFLFCPMTQEQECIVLCVDTSIKDQIVAFLCNETKISNGQIETIGKSFAEKVEKACQTCGYVSPFPNSSSVRISSLSLEACYSDSSFASMLCIEEYDGKKMPKNFRNPAKAKEEKVWYLGNLLMHEKNTALPEEIREMVRSGVFKKQKRR